MPHKFMVMPSENACGLTIVCLMDNNWAVRIVWSPRGGFGLCCVWIGACDLDDVDLHSNVSCELCSI